ncbi:MAG: hypothetical protein WD971_14565 [Pirellulales bacterium]
MGRDWIGQATLNATNRAQRDPINGNRTWPLVGEARDAGLDALGHVRGRSDQQDLMQKMQPQWRRRIDESVGEIPRQCRGDQSTVDESRNHGEIEGMVHGRCVNHRLLRRQIAADALAFECTVARRRRLFALVVRSAAWFAALARRGTERQCRRAFCVTMPMVMATANHRVDDQQDRRQIGE